MFERAEARRVTRRLRNFRWPFSSALAEKTDQRARARSLLHPFANVKSHDRLKIISRRLFQDLLRFEKSPRWRQFDNTKKWSHTSFYNLHHKANATQASRRRRRRDEKKEKTRAPLKVKPNKQLAFLTLSIQTRGFMLELFGIM